MVFVHHVTPCGVNFTYCFTVKLVLTSCIVVMFYYTLVNLRPELLSTHRSIQLIACVESPVLNKYGFGPIL